MTAISSKRVVAAWYDLVARRSGPDLQRFDRIVLTAYVRVELPDRCADRAAGQLFRAELDRTAALASEAIRRLEARSGPPEPPNPANGL